MKTAIDPKTPEGRHAIALGDFCNHLREARANAQKAIDSAHHGILRLERLLKKMPEPKAPAELTAEEEAALLETVETRLAEKETTGTWDGADDGMRQAQKATDEVIGRLNEVWFMLPYLKAGDFTDAENDA